MSDLIQSVAGSPAVEITPVPGPPGPDTADAFEMFAGDDADFAARMDRIDGHTIYVDDPRFTGADDTETVQNALDAANAAAPFATTVTVVFRGDYSIDTVDIPNIDGLRLVGEGRPRLTYSGPAGVDGTPAYMLNHDITTRFSGQSVTADITAGATTVTVSTVNAALAQVGDLVTISTTKSQTGASAYKHGAYRRITAINTGTGVLTLDGEIPTALATATDSITIAARKAVGGVTVTGIDFELYANSKAQALRLLFCIDARLDDCRFYGVSGNSFIGAGIDGNGTRVTRCHFENFRDGTSTFGYGIVTSGHDVVITDCTARYCKHGFTSGANGYETFGYTVARCNTYDAMLDAHGNCRFTKFVDNVVAGVGADSGLPGVGLWFRGRDSLASGNTIVTATSPGASSPVAIKLLELADARITIANNNCAGSAWAYGIKGDEQSNVFADDVLISGNTFGAEASGYGMYLKGYTNTRIAHNTITSAATGILVTNGASTSCRDIDISHNYIAYGASTSSSAVQLGQTGSTGKGWRVANNTFAPGASAGNAVRVFDKVDVVTITGNRIDPTGKVLTEPIRIVEATDLVTLVMGDNPADAYARNVPLAQAAAPASGAHVLGEIVYNSAPAASGFIGWVCVTAGTPGTWKTFGPISA